MWLWSSISTVLWWLACLKLLEAAHQTDNRSEEHKDSDSDNLGAAPSPFPGTVLPDVAFGGVCSFDCRNRQQAALLGLFSKLDGANWRNRDNWDSLSTSTDHCLWTGIQCCSDDNSLLLTEFSPDSVGSGYGTRYLSSFQELGISCSVPRAVVGLILPLNQLAGEMWEEMFTDLETLMFIDLSGNSLHGSVPTSIASLTALQYINLASNYITG